MKSLFCSYSLSKPIVQTSFFLIPQKQYLFQESYNDEPLLFTKKWKYRVLFHVENTFFAYTDHEYMTRQNLKVGVCFSFFLNPVASLWE